MTAFPMVSAPPWLPPARLLLINPNTSTAATAMMVAIASHVLPTNCTITGLTAEHGPALLTDEASLAASAQEVIRLALRATSPHSDMKKTNSVATPIAGVLIAAYGSPGLDALREQLQVPVTALSESAMRAAGNRPFGVATITPGLARSIETDAQKRGFGSLFTGVRLTSGDPATLAEDPEALVLALEIAVREAIELDGAQAVIIGGGPLGQAAISLAPRFTVPVIAPIPAATRDLLHRLGRA